MRDVLGGVSPGMLKSRRQCCLCLCVWTYRCGQTKLQSSSRRAAESQRAHWEDVPVSFGLRLLWLEKREREREREEVLWGTWSLPVLSLPLCGRWSCDHALSTKAHCRPILTVISCAKSHLCKYQIYNENMSRSYFIPKSKEENRKIYFEWRKWNKALKLFLEKQTNARKINILFI